MAAYSVSGKNHASIDANNTTSFSMIITSVQHISRQHIMCPGRSLSAYSVCRNVVASIWCVQPGSRQHDVYPGRPASAYGVSSTARASVRFNLELTAEGSGFRVEGLGSGTVR